MKPSERFEPKSDAVMSEDVVVQLLQLCDQHGIEVVVDGGWGVGALLGEQTRIHADLDIALEHKLVPKLRPSTKNLLEKVLSEPLQEGICQRHCRDVYTFRPFATLS